MKARINFSYLVVIVFIVSFAVACSKSNDVQAPPTPTPPTPPPAARFTDTAGPLKSVIAAPIGFAVNYNQFSNNTSYRNLVVREAASITPENEMKHSSIVRSDGTYNFTTTDPFVTAVTGAGLNVFGHTLGWHSQQNAAYLKSFSGITQASGAELLTNGGFESDLTGWSVFNNANGATVSITTTTSELRTGSRAMKVVNPVANPGNHWRVQVAGPLINTTVGKDYTVTYWVKASAAGGSIRLSTQDNAGGNAAYQGDQTIGTTYQQISWTFNAKTTQTRFLFDMGLVANTYFVDDVSLKEVITSTGTEVAAKLDQALASWINALVGRYVGKVKGWDVINELFAEDGAIRNNTNTNTSSSDVFVWSEYMGRDFALKAFNYAKAADPAADLYINDYNLETNSRKLDSLIKYVAELRSKGAKVDGIGTQMHISWNTSSTGIDDMFTKLAATGLKVRISELDVRTSGSGSTGVPNSTTLTLQAEKIYNVVNSYLKKVPKAQQGGITVWGVNDNSSWLYNNGAEFPLLFDSNFGKKPAYSGFLEALKDNK